MSMDLDTQHFGEDGEYGTPKKRGKKMSDVAKLVLPELPSDSKLRWGISQNSVGQIAVKLLKGSKDHPEILFTISSSYVETIAEDVALAYRNYQIVQATNAGTA